MKKTVLFLLPFIISLTTAAQAQRTFKAGWNTYTASLIIHEYTYSCTIDDSVRLAMSDSAQIMCTADSSVVMCANMRLRDNATTKTIHYFNGQKKCTKTEEYKGDNLVMVREWRYDEKGRKLGSVEDNKASGKSYKRNYEYATDKKTGDQVVTEVQYYNGRAEFYTKSYYDKKGVKYKEVRLNDNNKDVIHIESYTYAQNGKVKERTVYFPEFKVTKKFQEDAPDDLPKCAKTSALDPASRIFLPGKATYLRNFMRKVQAQISDPDCTRFEYKYANNWQEIMICTVKPNNATQVVLRCKERI